MSYTAKVFYVLESDPTYTLKYDSHVKDVNIGDSFSLSFLDFDYNGTHYYVKYAINNGSVYKRGVNTIDCKSMMISDDYRYMSWYVFCTEDETDITGDCAVSYTDIATELYLSISTGNSDSVSTRGKETLISVSISQGCVSDSFASYGSTYSPTMSCEMYAENNDFTDALIAKTYYDNTLKGTIVNAWILIGNEFAYPVPIGRFVVKENPTYNGDTVSFTGNGLMSEYMDRAEIVISSLNEYHKTELEEKYVPSQLQFIYTRDDVYYWEYLPQDFLRVTGCPLYIDNWKDVLSSIKQYKLYHLMIPMLSNFADNDEDGYDWDWESRITWRDLLSGIAVLLRANVIEKNGAFYIKQLPELQADNNYRPIFNGDTYDSNAIFGNNLMCPNNVSVKANNWYFYETNSDYVGFGYYEGESTVVLNDKASSVSNVENYPVTIETPWILYETLDRNTVHTYLGQVTPMQWKTGLSFLNKAFVYHKASIETMYWHPLMSVGEMLTFEDYDGVKKYVLVGEMTLYYDGGFYAEITSPCEVQESNSSSVGSSGSSSYNSGTMAQASGTVTSTILGAIFKDGVITNSKIADSTIENSKIKDSTITNAKIADATIELEKVSKSFITDLTADNAYIKHLKATIGEFGYITAENADLTYATITSLQAVDGKIDTLTAKAITTDNLEAKVATLGYLSAESADVKFATIESLTAVDGKIDTLSSKAITTENLSAKVADLGYLSADSAEISYAKIDFSNVGTQVVSSSMIIDGAVTNEKVANLSANKITSGTIDASKITVTNLNADNITVGTINGQRIGNGSLSLDKLAEEVPTKEYLDNVEKNLQGQIDGAIETFTKSEIPTLNNEPANAWTDNATRKKHIGDVCYVVNPTSTADGYCYRFTNVGTEDNPSYTWSLIKDSDVTKALQEIIDINGEIKGIKRFDSEISAWKVDTDLELSSLKTRTMNLETEMGDKVSTSTFNDVKQTVDKNSASITSLSDTVGKKADGSTVETLTNTVNEVKQTADSNSLSISSMQTEIGKKADDSTVTELSTKTSKLEQNLDGFKTEVSKTYTTKTEFDDLSVGGRNMCIGTNQGTKNWGWSMRTGTYTNEEVLEDGIRTCKMTRGDDSQSGWPFIHFDDISRDKWLPNTDYIITVEVKSNVNTTFTLYGLAASDGTGNLSSKIDVVNNNTKSGEWVTLQWLCKTRNQLPTQTNQMLYMNNMNSEPGVYYQFRNLKIEKGNKATDWSPAPEDIEQTAKSYTDQKADEISQVVSKKVGADEIISKINQTAETITIDASKLNLTGYVTIENLKGSGTTEINGANIITGSIDANKLNVTDLSALNASIGGFRITEDAITTSGETFYTALSSKPLTDETPYGALVSYWRMSGAGTYYGSYSQISYGILEAGTISGTTPTYTPHFKVNGDSVTLEKIDTALRVATEYGLGASLTDYSLQISPTSGNHMNLGQRTIQAVDKNNAATTLYLNSYGGSISIGRVNGAGTTTLNANVVFGKHCSSVTTTTPSSTILYGITMNGGLFKAVVFRNYSIASASPWASIVQTELMPGDSGAADVVQYHNMVTGRGECVRVAFNAKTGNLAVNAQYNAITNDNLNGIAIFPVLQ
jgi:hypothetical protein